MVKLLGLLLCVVMFPSSVSAELTKQDLQEIQAMFDRHRADIDQALDRQERTLKEYIGIIGVLVVALLGTPQWISLSRERREVRGQDLLNARLAEIREEMRREFEQKLQAVQKSS